MKLIELISLIEKNDESYDFYNNNKQEISNEINQLLLSDNFSTLIPLFDYEKFYDILSKLYLIIEHDNKIIFLGKLWVEFYISLDSDKKNNFLSKALDTDDTWHIIHMLDGFFEFVPDLDSNTLINILIPLSKFCENDGANYIFYDALDKYVQKHIKSSNEILRILLKIEFNDNISILCQTILGRLRVLDKKLISDIDNYLISSYNIQYLKCYYRSLLPLYSVESEFNISFLDDILNKKNINLQDIAFYLAFKLHIAFVNNKQIQNYIFDWVLEKTSLELNDFSKYYILKLIHIRVDNYEFDSQIIIKAVINIQPIEIDKLGLWNTLEYILFNFLKNENFKILLNGIITKNQDNFFKILSKFQYFKENFISTENIKLCTELFCSKDKYERKFIQILYTDFKIKKFNLDTTIIELISDNMLELIFKEILSYDLLGDSISAFIIDINMRLNKITNPNLKSLIKDEIIYQCMNYHSSCYLKLDKLEYKSDILKEALIEAKKYYEAKKSHNNSPVNSFTFPKSNEIAFRAKYIQDREIRENEFKYSVFADIISKIPILYYNKFSSFTNLSEPTKLKTFEHSIEYPICTVLDPCRERYKRISFIQDIKLLQEIIDNEK